MADDSARGQRSGMASKRYDKDFHDELRTLYVRLRPRFSREELGTILHVNPSQLSTWLHGHRTPIWLARQAVLFILRDLDRSSLRS